MVNKEGSKINHYSYTVGTGSMNFLRCSKNSLLSRGTSPRVDDWVAGVAVLAGLLLLLMLATIVPPPPLTLLNSEAPSGLLEVSVELGTAKAAEGEVMVAEEEEEEEEEENPEKRLGLVGREEVVSNDEEVEEKELGSEKAGADDADDELEAAVAPLPKVNLVVKAALPPPPPAAPPPNGVLPKEPERVESKD